MSNRYRDWAKGEAAPVDLSGLKLRRSITPAPVTQPIQVQQPAPQPSHVPTIFNAAGQPSRQPGQMFSGYQAGVQRPALHRVPIHETCVIVKPGNHDGYQEFLATLPDLAVEAGIDLSNGIDAMTLAGVPERGEMRAWTENSRYYTGTTDAKSNGMTVGQALQQQHGVTLASVRSSQAANAVRTGTGARRS